MEVTIFYDRKTGEILHSHHEVRVVEGGRAGETQAVAPNAADVEALAAALVSGGVAPDRLGRLTAELSAESDRAVKRSVDVKIGQLRTWRLEEGGS